MPVYTYRCESCGVQFERSQKFTDSPLVRCPECGKKTLRKVYTPVGIVFKGSGFYSTDHRSPSGASRFSKDQAEAKAAESKPAEAESKSSESESSESKPAESKTETKPAATSNSDSESNPKADKKD